VFILASDLATQSVVSVLTPATIRQRFFEQLTQSVPSELMPSSVWMNDLQYTALGIIAIVRFVQDLSGG
jgi:hypothetical protein